MINGEVIWSWGIKILTSYVHLPAKYSGAAKSWGILIYFIMSFFL